MVEGDQICFICSALGADSSFASPGITKQSYVLEAQKFILCFLFLFSLTMSINMIVTSISRRSCHYPLTRALPINQAEGMGGNGSVVY